nr:LPXTG cell wall anchor domain-containing protein [Staphylococcus pettenkoferi]
MDNNCPTGDVEHPSTEGEKAPTSPSAQTEGHTEVPAQTPSTTHNTMNNGAETAGQEQHATQDTMSSYDKVQPTHATTHSDAKALPETGESDTARTTAFGSLFAGLGALLLFRRRKNSKDEQ